MPELIMKEVMTYTVLIEPAPQHRAAFARWCLAQTPPILTATAFGSLVPSDLFADVPEELLTGAKIDGTLYRHVLDDFVPHGAGYRDAPAIEPDGGAKPEPLTTPKPRPRARRTRKPVTE